MTMLVGTRSGSQPPSGHRSATASARRRARRVVIGQPLDHGAQGHQAGGGDHPGLPHGPAQSMALDPGLDHDVGRSGQDRPDRGAEALRQTGHDGGDRVGEVGGRRAGGHFGVEEPGPVHVDGQPPGRHGQRLQGGHRPGDAPRRHVGVLDADEFGDRVVMVGGPQGPGDGRRVEGPVVVVDLVELDPGVARRRRRVRR